MGWRGAVSTTATGGEGVFVIMRSHVRHSGYLVCGTADRRGVLLLWKGVLGHGSYIGE